MKKPKNNGFLPYVARGREFDDLLVQLQFTEADCKELLEIPGRTQRRYRRGDGKAPTAVLKLLRLLASGALTRRQIERA